MTLTEKIHLDWGSSGLKKWSKKESSFNWPSTVVKSTDKVKPDYFARRYQSFPIFTFSQV